MCHAAQQGDLRQRHHHHAASDRSPRAGRAQGPVLAPELVAEFVQAYAAELAAADREATLERSRAEADLADVARRLPGVTNAIENGAWNETLKARLAELERQQARLTTKLAQEPPARPVAQPHPGAANLYRQQVADLERRSTTRMCALRRPMRCVG